MLVGPNGRPVVKSEGPTGRRLILHEFMENGAPALKTEPVGAWFVDNSPPEQLRGRLLISTYFLRAATAILSDMLGTFVDQDVNKAVQSAINKLAEGAKDGV